MKFLQVGLGSMGKRRIRNLLALGVKSHEITGFDFSPQRAKEVKKMFGIATYTDFATAQKLSDADAYIISTPPDKHHQYFLVAAKKKKHFFVEVGTSSVGYAQLFKLLNKSVVAAPSCTFRYFRPIIEIKKLVNAHAIGEVLSFQYHLGQYLPDWHPWEDYRKVFFAQKKSGGCRETFVFELLWLTDLFQAQPSRVTGFTEKLSSLEMTADDQFAAAIQFTNKITGTINIDLLARAPLRKLRLVGTTGVLEWSWIDSEIKLYQTKTKKWRTIKIPAGKRYGGYLASEDMYIAEIKAFIAAIKNKKQFPHTFKADYTILKTLEALEKSHVKTI